MPPKILIVDDEPGIVDMLQSYFAAEYQVLTAASGHEALQKAAASPDLILLDINMPGLDGLSARAGAPAPGTAPPGQGGRALFR